jgi:MFS family permease
MDKLGRRILLLLSAIVMAASSILIGIYFFLQSEGVNVENFGWLPIFALCLFIITFSLGFGPVPWLMVGELFPANVKNLSGSLSGTFNWLLAFVITKTFASLSAAMGIGPVFWLFAALTIIGAIFVFLFVPETKGKTLAEIQRMLSRERSS